MRHAVLFGAAFLVSCSSLLASPPETLSVQGRLENPAGVPMSGTTTLTIRLYNVVNDGSALFTEDREVTFDSRGSFVAMLGADQVLLDLDDFGGPLYMSVALPGQAELSPRIPLAPAPYALHASVAGVGLRVGDQAPTLSVTADTTIVPTHRLHLIEPDSATPRSVATIATTYARVGDTLTLLRSTAQSGQAISLQTSGNIALSPLKHPSPPLALLDRDSITFVYDGASWVETSYSDF